ncbi:sensor histidine kinase [Nocardioides sp. SYSU DS0663]|uniref:sensor histidine kinase n=1 Tax=Nocardioides sp. SYSU DS0663 TaxID=3416445 RepID=UPI003F4C476E
MTRPPAPELRVPSDRTLRLVATVLATVAVLCCAAVHPLQAVLDGRTYAGDVADLTLGIAWPVVGALVVRARPRNPVGWLMLLPALIGPYHVLALYAAHVDGQGVLGGFAAWVAVWGFAPYFFTLPLLPHVFPDGHVLGPRWRPVVAVVVLVATVTTLARMVAPVATDIAPDVTNPLGLPALGWWRYVTLTGSVSLFVLGIPLAVVSLALRMRRARDAERTQLQWLFLGGLVLVVAVLSSGAGLTHWLEAIGLAALPVSIGIAMLRHGLFDVELTLNRTLVFGLLTGAVVAVYVAVVYGVQAVAPESTWSVVLVALAAFVAAAGRDRVQELVDRWLFGHRHNPYAVVSRVGRHVAAASEPVEALQRLVDGLRDALRLPSVGFTGADVSVASGTPLHGSRVVPCTALGTQVGELHVGLRAPGERWSAEQEAAVEEVAGRAGTLAYAATLVADVARSRGRIVAAREEERRRLRADLHDGVAPSLAGTALQLDSLAKRLERDELPALAERVGTLRDGLRGTVTELRALVHGLRPPVLDQRGLAGALRDLVTGHDTPRCVAEVADLGAPRAAVEVAAYAIASEALSNALRHAVATEVCVRARTTGGDLVVEVVDDGVGLPPRPRAGVGTTSMRERAAEVGGRLDQLPTPGGGTTVRATLPLEVL